MGYTPMMEQYLAVKEKYKDCILFYRLGDFYEMFFDDAIIASKVLELVLTKKACGQDQKAPMCGVPYHAVENYIAKMVEHGYKVAIAEQLTDPALSKGIVERDVIRVITPGTVIQSSMLSEKDNNYLASVYINDKKAGLAYTDISTGEFCALQIGSDDFIDVLLEELTRIQPKEIITNAGEDDCSKLWEYASEQSIFISKGGERLFGNSVCSKSIRDHYKIPNEKSIGLASEDVPLLFYSIGALLAYLKETQKQDVEHLSQLQIKDVGGCMLLDRATIRNLEITESLYDRKSQGSLFGILDACGSAMGSRKLKSWLREPLIEISAIQNRLDAVEELADNILIRNNLKEALRAIYDLERILARISLGTANARDLIALKVSLSVIPDIKDCLASLDSKLLSKLNDEMDPLTDLCNEIEAAIVEDPPYIVREGGLIKKGYSEELDGIYESAKEGRLWIAGLENSERERTGIKQIKVGYNKVFGYYIEISKGYKGDIPDNYIRKQTLVNGERYITPELKEVESVVLNAQTKINDLEYRLFNELRDKVKSVTAIIQRTASAIASSDALCSFAEQSAKLGYVKPTVDDGDEIIIKKGRHPVIENTVENGSYISNDVYLNRKDASLLIITGPNMSGKSTYMRQLALIVLMAQAGCFVPAQEAHIGICDRIYTRIGASDNISMGQSTFYVEMSELAYILNTATEKSLIILDEIGRGTSTYDGLSIAWAVVENLTKDNHRIRTLFATHYHELTKLSEKIEGVKNLNVDVSEKDGTIVFLHKIVEGAASRSYGIHVAKLAGVPEEVLLSAQKKLNELENEQN